MEATKAKAQVAAGALILAAILGFSLIGIAGSLEPSGPPGPTMKTLDEVEPGKPISSVPYIISEPGSYYLSADAQTTSNMFSGITIWASDVTLDLKGFSLVGDGTAGRHGVFIEGELKNIVIRNGTIRNWGGNGVEAATATKCQALDLRVTGNDGSGINLPGDGQVVSKCMTSDNGDSSSTDVSGIYVGDGSRVTGNTCSGNGESADGDVYGIRTGRASTIRGNIAQNNGTFADGDYVYGIYAGIGGTVIGNTANDNGDGVHNGSIYGIYVRAYNLVDQNTAFDNGFGSDSAENMTLGVNGCTYGNNVPK
ncbi:MAG: right-handed parallel beta-helix repeat-containing protein [Planctomycetota bacterium]|jgi:hypothetical protein